MNDERKFFYLWGADFCNLRGGQIFFSASRGANGGGADFCDLRGAVGGGQIF